MKKIIAANWKNNGSTEFVKDYFDFFLKNKNANNEIIIFPPDLYINQVCDYKNKKNFSLGGQRVNSDGGDTHTSGTKSEMFIDNGCDYVLVGHSEIRSLSAHKDYGADDLYGSSGLQAIFCIGEDEDARKIGNTGDVLEKQLEDLCRKENYPIITPKKAIIAYEPVWAIGTGNTPKIDDISFIHRLIKTYVSENHPFVKEKDIMVLYGGSVNSKNAKDILSASCVDGVLIGGASLDVKEFTKICNLKI
tara:strand:- start:428 stop:1171 length:744 start_codon:yes stop_codon:yes gene_type:complete